MTEPWPEPDPAPVQPAEQALHCCSNINRENVQKTILVEQFLLPLLQHYDLPGGIITEFKRRWREASLLGKTLPALRTICRRHHITITPEMTEHDLRTAILHAEDPQ